MLYAYITHKLFGWKWGFVHIGQESMLTRFMIVQKSNRKRQVWIFAKTIGPFGEWVALDDWNRITPVYPGVRA